MNLKKLWLLLAMFFAFVFSGCVSTTLYSMGKLNTPTVHQPRLDPTNKKAENVISVDAFGVFYDEMIHVDNINAGGGILSYTYRFGGSLSPLFLTANFAAAGGSVNFTCSNSSCNDKYETWLLTSEAKKDYDFWTLQEEILVGGDFQLPANFFLGISAGIHMYQSDGSYQKQAKKMSKNKSLYGVSWEDDAFVNLLALNLWVGYHIGEKGKYGSVALQTPGEIRLAYFHPTGFHGSLGLNGVSIGKSFTF